MRTFIFALAAIVPASCAIDRAWAADALPAFDIARNCNAEVIGLGTSVEACTKDETDRDRESLPFSALETQKGSAAVFWLATGLPTGLRFGGVGRSGGKRTEDWIVIFSAGAELAAGQAVYACRMQRRSSRAYRSVSRS